MTLARHQYGTYLEYSLVEGGPYTTLSEVKKITPPKYKGGLADATHLLSPGFTKEMIASWKERGTAAATLNFISAVHNTLFLLCKNQTTVFFRLVLPLAAGEAVEPFFPFTAQITTCNLADVEVGDKVHETELEFAVQGEAQFQPAV